MANIKINKFNGVVTFMDENDLTLETLKDSKNFRFEGGSASESYPRLSEEILPSLDEGYEWETGIVTLLNADILQKEINTFTYKVVLLVAKRKIDNWYLRKIYYKLIDKTDWTNLTEEGVEGSISEILLRTQIDAKTKLVNDNGVLKIYTPSQSLWFGVMDRTIYIGSGQTKVNDGFYLCLLTDLNGNGINAAESTLGVIVSASAIDTRTVVPNPTDYFTFSDGVEQKDTSLVSALKNTWHLNLTLNDKNGNSIINPLVKDYPGGQTNVITFLKEYKYDFPDQGWTTDFLIPWTFVNDLYEPVDLSILGGLRNGYDTYINASLKMDMYQTLNNGMGYGKFYRVKAADLKLSKWKKKAGDANGALGFPVASYAHIITTAILDDTTEIIVSQKKLVPPISYLPWQYNYQLNIETNFNQRLSKVRVYSKLEDTLDYELLHTFDLLDDEVVFQKYLSPEDQKGIYLTQNIGFTVDEENITNYKLISAFKDVAFERGYSIATANNKVYYPAVGGGKVQTDLFYQTNLVKVDNDNSINAVIGLNGKFGVLNNDTLFIVTFQEIDGVAVFETQESLEYGIENKEDYTLIKGGAILHTSSGLFFTNGYETSLISEQINDVIKANYLTGKIKYDSNKHELYYWNSNVLKYWLFSFERKLWEKYDLGLEYLSDIIFDLNEVIFLCSGEEKEITIYEDVVTYNETLFVPDAITGLGTALNPFMLYKASHIGEIPTKGLNKYYKMGNSIDMVGIEHIPIGSSSAPFTGNYDGDNYSISNLNVQVLNVSGNYGFFGSMQGTLKNIVFDNANLIFNNPTAIMNYDLSPYHIYVGVACGESTSPIENVHVINSLVDITAASYTTGWGGNSMPHQYTLLIGNYNGLSRCSVSDSRIKVSIPNHSGSMGLAVTGFAGHSSGGNISECYSSNNIIDTTGSDSSIRVCGLCYSSSVWTGYQYRLMNSYARNTLLIASSQAASNLMYGSGGWFYPEKVYSAGVITGASNQKCNLVVFAGGLGSNNYHDHELSVLPGADVETGMTALTTANMKLQESFVNWDFATTWAINPAVNDGYPYLLLNNFTIIPAPLESSPIITKKEKKVIINTAASLLRSNGDRGINDNFFETIESDLGSPEAHKWLNRIFIDYVNEGELVIFLDGVAKSFVLDSSGREYGSRGSDMLYMPLTQRVPFKKIKVRCNSGNSLIIYSLLLDIDTANYESEFKNENPNWENK